MMVIVEEGRKGGKKEGREEGRKEGRKEEREEGRKGCYICRCVGRESIALLVSEQVRFVW